MRYSYLYRTALAVTFLFAGVPAGARAAVITFDPQQNAVGTHSTFDVAINIDADQPINALSLTIAFSENLEPVDISDGNSVVHLWVDKPVYDARKNTLTFSGLFPGGFSGNSGRLLTMTMRASKPGVGGIRVVDPSHIYLNTPDATEDAVESHTLSLEVDDAHDNLADPLLDTTAPESFTPEIALLPSSDTSDAWMLVFATTDKGAGVDYAEVSESNPLLPWTIEWHRASSPYRLQDQTRSSRIDIRVYDKKGNVRSETLMAGNAQSTLLYAAFILGAGIIGVLLWLRRR